MTLESTPSSDDQLAIPTAADEADEASPAPPHEEPNKLREALGRFTRVRDRYRARRRAEALFVERCGHLLDHVRRTATSKEIVEAVELLGDLVAFSHTDGDGNEIRLILSPQRDRAIINQRFLNGSNNEEVAGSRREGSDILLAVHAISREVSPDRCLIFQLLRPVEIFAIQYIPDSDEPRPFIGNRFGLVSSKEHMHDFVMRLASAPSSEERPLPAREAIPELIEACLEDQLADSIEECTHTLERDLDRPPKS